MKLCLDNIIFSLQRMGGISVYWSELWTRLLRDGVDVTGIEGPDPQNNLFRAGFDLPGRQLRHDSRPLRLARYLSAPTLYGQDELLHSSYYRPSLSDRVPHVQTCYDFTYERFWSGPARWAHSWQKRRALGSAAGVICISESTRRDLLHFCPEVHPERIRVIHLGCSDVFRPLPSDEVDRLIEGHVDPQAPFALFVGDRSSYKNFSVAVDAVALVPGLRLVVVGGGPMGANDGTHLERRLPERWTHVPRAPGALLNGLFNRAHALLYLSSYEGFGIPVLEGMAAGCPVIAINVSSIPEAAGDAGLLLDEPEADAAAEQLRRLFVPATRAIHLERGWENARRFSWERCYRETLAFYATVMEPSRTDFGGVHSL